VLLYVLFIYLAYNILIREDDFEAEIAKASAAAYQHVQHPIEAASAALNSVGTSYPTVQTSDNGVYTLTYPSTPRVTSSQPSKNLFLWVVTRATTYMLIYPAVSAFNVVSFCLHYISATLVLMLYATNYLFNPLTDMMSLMCSTVILTPGKLFLSVARIFYPAYVLLGGLFGIGTSLGLCVGWIGRRLEGAIYKRSAERRSAAAATRAITAVPQQEYPGSHPFTRPHSVPAYYNMAAASRSNGTPFRTGRRSRNLQRRERPDQYLVHDLDSVGLGLDPVPVLPQEERRRSASKIKFLEPTPAVYYHSNDSEDEDEDDLAETVGKESYPRYARRASPRSVMQSIVAGETPHSEAQQAFHFHFHQPTAEDAAMATPALPAAARRRPGSFSHAATETYVKRDGSETGSLPQSRQRMDTVPPAQGVRKRTRQLQRQR
jgi:hypothetical protein